MPDITGNLRQVNIDWKKDCARYEREIRAMDVGYSSLRAEIVAGVDPGWYVATVFTGHEQVSAAHLIARGHKMKAVDHMIERGFGVCVPEGEVVEVRRGRKVEVKQVLLPGYVFVFVWDVVRHIGRICACPGVTGMLMAGAMPAVVPDDVMYRLRVIENMHRGPMTTTIEEFLPTKRKRQSRRTIRTVPIGPEEIVKVGCYAAVSREQEEFKQQMQCPDPEHRLSAFHKAMGLIPQAA